MRFTQLFKFSHLKRVLDKDIIPQTRERFQNLKKKHGDKVIGEIKLDSVLTGMKSLPVLFYDGSTLDPVSGITFRAHTIPEFCEYAIKAPGGVEPLPECMFFLLLTGRYPKHQEVDDLIREWQLRGTLTRNDVNFILSLPKSFHPMTMLSMTLLHLQAGSKFFEAYHQGVSKAKFWEYYYEDAMDLIAKMPLICANIYRHKYKDSKLIEPNHKLDWIGNFSHMLGYEEEQMKECLRAYIAIHADHEGGNVSAHTCQLVSSTLADPYLAYSAAMNGLAGPLHGLANQECLKWLIELKNFHKGKPPTKEIIQEFVKHTLDSGRVVPGYGHAVLRNTDPRFIHLKNFAERNVRNDYLCELALECFEVIPEMLGKIGKIKNPYPNVDAFSGSLLHHYGMKEHDMYTVVFSVSRVLGCMSNGIWGRILGLPIERPNSIDINFIEGLEK